MALPRDASLDDLVTLLNSDSYDPVATVNAALEGKSTLQEHHFASAEFAAQVDGQSQELIQQLQQVLQTLQRSERRIPHEIDLLRSDIRSFNENLTEALPPVAKLAAEGTRSPVLSELAKLDEVKTRMEEVSSLLIASTTSTKDPETLRKLAAVFAGTPEESKRRQQAAGSGYYDLFNKIIT